MSNNLSIWNELAPVQKTACKEFKRGGWGGTAINPAWIMKRLTDVFGPVGQGWGVELLDESFEKGHMIEGTGTRVVVHVVRVQLWYSPSGKSVDRCYTIPQYGQTTFVGSNARGVFTDEEAPKKSITDAIGKCAVSLGLAADIYLSDAAGGGLWDGNKYVNDPQATLAGEKTPPAATAQKTTRSKAKAPPAKAPELSQYHKDVAKGIGVDVPDDVPFDATGDDPLHGVDSETWDAEQWTEFLETLDPTPEVLLKVFSAVTAKGLRSKAPGDVAEYERICGAFADVFRVVCEGQSAERTKLLSLFKKQRKLIDSTK